eukprot:8582361-Alexandrium_andersonii.AAC.1
MCIRDRSGALGGTAAAARNSRHSSRANQYPPRGRAELDWGRKQKQNGATLGSQRQRHQDAWPGHPAP